jgi:hypothetical protein
VKSDVVSTARQGSERLEGLCVQSTSTADQYVGTFQFPFLVSQSFIYSFFFLLTSLSVSFSLLNHPGAIHILSKGINQEALAEALVSPAFPCPQGDQVLTLVQSSLTFHYARLPYLYLDIATDGTPFTARELALPGKDRSLSCSARQAERQCHATCRPSVGPLRGVNAERRRRQRAT